MILERFYHFANATFQNDRVDRIPSSRTSETKCGDLFMITQRKNEIATSVARSRNDRGGGNANATFQNDKKLPLCKGKCQRS